MIQTLTFLLYLIVAGYFLLQCYFVYHWRYILRTAAYRKGSPGKTFSIVISARNAGNVISECIDSFHNLNYPDDKFEVLLINDHSEDDTTKVASNLGLNNLRIIDLPDGINGKKQAVIHGINCATGEIVVCTDADCIVPPDWLNILSFQFEDHEVSGVCGPVFPYEQEVDDSLLYHFQVLDYAGMMSITAVAIKQNLFSLGNGANLAFRRAKVEPEKVDWKHTNASGDDIAIINYLQKNGFKIVFSTDPGSIVHTLPETKWSDFFNQRIRWGSKNKATGQRILIMQLTFLLLMCMAHVIAVPFFLIGLFMGYSVPVVIAVIAISKYVADFLLLWQSTLHFKKIGSMKYFPVLCWVHSFYISITGLISILPVTYTWKGRRVS